MTSAEPPDTDDPATVLTADFSNTARSLFAASSVEGTLGLIISLAGETIEGCDFAGLLLVQAGAVTSPAHTDPIVTDLDALQRHIGEGPGLDASVQGIPFYADDLDSDPRWPRFAPLAAAQGVRSLLAIPLFGNGTLGALNLYAQYPAAFGVIDRARGLLFAALAGLAFTTAQSHEDEERRAANLHAALATRELIGQAQGILIERERLTPDQAFDILRRASQHLNIKLQEVAQTLVETGERPDIGQPDARRRCWRQRCLHIGRRGSLRMVRQLSVSIAVGGS